MVRIIKAYDERLNELLDAAQQLFFQKGYELTTVNDIIHKIGIAKGTFYHYFKSKEDLLDKLVERFTEKTYLEVKKLVRKKDMNAIDKMNNFFIAIRDSKIENMELMKMLMKVLYKDENLIFRYKMFRKNMERLQPEFSEIIRQGGEEGHFKPVDHVETAELIFTMGITLNEIVVGLLMDLENKPENLDKIDKKLKVYERSIERVLGAPEGVLQVVNRKYINMFRLDL